MAALPDLTSPEHSVINLRTLWSRYFGDDPPAVITSGVWLRCAV